MQVVDAEVDALERARAKAGWTGDQHALGAGRVRAQQEAAQKQQQQEAGPK